MTLFSLKSWQRWWVMITIVMNKVLLLLFLMRFSIFWYRWLTWFCIEYIIDVIIINGYFILAYILMTNMMMILVMMMMMMRIIIILRLLSRRWWWWRCYDLICTFNWSIWLFTRWREILNRWRWFVLGEWRLRTIFC